MLPCYKELNLQIVSMSHSYFFQLNYVAIAGPDNAMFYNVVLGQCDRLLCPMQKKPKQNKTKQKQKRKEKKATEQRKKNNQKQTNNNITNDNNNENDNKIKTNFKKGKQMAKQMPQKQEHNKRIMYNLLSLALGVLTSLL